MFSMSAREFNQAVASAQRRAETEPVLITRRGEPAFVLMNYVEFQRLSARADGSSLSERLSIPPSDDPEADAAAAEEFSRILAEVRASALDRPPLEF